MIIILKGIHPEIVTSKILPVYVVFTFYYNAHVIDKQLGQTIRMFTVACSVHSHMLD